MRHLGKRGTSTGDEKGTHSDEELIDELITISVIAKRFAEKLRYQVDKIFVQSLNLQNYEASANDCSRRLL